MEMPFPIVQKPLHFYHDRSQAPEYLKAANKVIEQADGFVVVNGEYNRSVQPGLTNMLDHFPPASYAKRPCAFASYSMGIGPALLSTSHMRDVVAELGMIVSPKVCGVIEIHKEFDENNQPMNEEVRGRRDEMIEDFLWLCDALKSKRKDNE